MRVLVTGASGYLGGRLAHGLASAGHEVVSQIRTPETSLSFPGEVITCDLSQGVGPLVDAAPEAVVHTVSLNHKRSEEDVGLAMRVNVQPVWDLLKGLPGLRRFVYFSTFQVYGPVPAEPITEDSATNPRNAYGLTHLLAETVLKRFETPSVSLRLTNGYGAPQFARSDCWWLVINDLCRTAVREGKIQLLSEGLAQRDFVDIKDVVGAVNLLLERESDPVLTLSSGRTHYIIELAHEVARLASEKLGKKIPVVLPGDQVSETCPDLSEKARFSVPSARLRALGWEPSQDLSPGIQEVLDFCLSHE